MTIRGFIIRIISVFEIVLFRKEENMKKIVSTVLILILTISLCNVTDLYAASIPSSEYIKNAYISMSHPYIGLSASDAENIKKKIVTDSWFRAQYNSYLDSADSLLNQSPVPYTHDGTHIDTSSGSDASRLSFAYVITGDSKYAAKAWQFAEIVCNYKDWNYSKQYLDTADIAMHLAYVYDSLYDYLNVYQKQKLLSSIKKKGLDEAIRFYDGTTDATCLYWPTDPNNWNIVCNGGILTAATAIFDADPDYCSKVISKGLSSLEYGMPTYLPDGGFEEGSSYWTYATSYLVCALDAFRTGFGTDFGLSEKYSLENTAKFPLYMDSDYGTFSVGDGYQSQQITSDAYYLALKSGDTALASVIVDKLKEYNKSVNLIFLKNYEGGSVSYDAPPLDAKFEKPATGTMRQTWKNGGNYVAFHGGSNSLGHGDLDIGTFVFDSDGKRFITELGRDDYYYPGYWDHSKRYTYYAKRGEGNNVLLINPKGKLYDQEYNAKSEITCFESAELGGLGVLNTTEAYGAYVNSAQRGFMLSDNRRILSIRDEVDFKNDNNDVYWFAHTWSDIEISGDGKTAIMTLGNSKVRATLDCSVEDAIFTVMDAVHMSDDVKPPQQYITDYTGYRKLTVHTTADRGDFYLLVNMALEKDGFDTKKLYVSQPIANWSVCNSVKEESDYRITSGHSGDAVDFNNKVISFTYPGAVIADYDSLCNGIKIFANAKLLDADVDYMFLPVDSEIKIRFTHPLMHECDYKIVINGITDIKGKYLDNHTFSFVTQCGTTKELAVSKGRVECNKNILIITPAVYLSEETNAKLLCYVDEELAYEINNYPYICELTRLSKGNHNIRIVLQAFGKESNCSFTYDITEEYSIDIFAYPIEDSKIMYCENIEFRADISDAEYVEFYIDGEFVTNFRKAPYIYTIQSIKPGTHTFTVSASNLFGTVTKTTNFDVDDKYRNNGKYTEMNFDSLEPGDAVSLYPDVHLYGMSSCKAILIDAGAEKGTAVSFVSTDSSNYVSGFSDWSGYWHDAVKVEYDIMLSGSLNKTVRFPMFEMSDGTAASLIVILNGTICDEITGETYGTIELDKWYKVEVIVDSVEQTYSLYINQKLIHTRTDIKVLGSHMRNFNTYFTTGPKGSSVCFDNYAVSYLFKNPSVKSLKLGQNTASDYAVLKPNTDKVNIEFYNALILPGLTDKVYWTDGRKTENANYTFENIITRNGIDGAYNFEIMPPNTLSGKVKLVFDAGISCFPKNKTSIYTSEIGISAESLELDFVVVDIGVETDAVFEADGKIINSIFNVDEVSSSVELVNNTKTEYNVYAVLASYCGVSLVDVDITPYELTPGIKTKLYNNAVSVKGADSVKCYIWTNNLSPVYSSILD